MIQQFNKRKSEFRHQPPRSPDGYRDDRPDSHPDTCPGVQRDGRSDGRPDVRRDSCPAGRLDGRRDGGLDGRRDGCRDGRPVTFGPVTGPLHFCPVTVGSRRDRTAVPNSRPDGRTEDFS